MLAEAHFLLSTTAELFSTPTVTSFLWSDFQRLSPATVVPHISWCSLRRNLNSWVARKGAAMIRVFLVDDNRDMLRELREALAEEFEIVGRLKTARMHLRLRSSSIPMCWYWIL